MFAALGKIPKKVFKSSKIFQLLKIVYSSLGSLSFGLGLFVLPFAQCYHPWWILVFFCFIYCLAGSYGRSFVSTIFLYVHIDKYWTILILAKTFAELGGTIAVSFSGFFQEFTVKFKRFPK